MKAISYVLVGLALTNVAGLIVLTPWQPKNGFEIFLVLLYFAFAGIGQWWMIIVILRRESKIWPVLLAAFLLPFSFIGTTLNGTVADGRGRLAITSNEVDCGRKYRYE